MLFLGPIDLRGNLCLVRFDPPLIGLYDRRRGHGLALRVVEKQDAPECSVP